MGTTREAIDLPVSIGFIGLATSHPYADAATIIARHPDAVVHVWEPDPERMAAFLERFSQARVHETLAGIVDAELDGAIISVPPPGVAAAVAAIAEQAFPVFINKPAAASLTQLDAVDAVVRPIAERVLSTSVLRFAAPVRQLSERIDLSRVLSARAVVRHDVARWLSGSTDWQDDIDVGGGTIVTIGIHGMELLTTLLGTDFEIRSSLGEVRHLQGLKSDDTAVIGLRWSNGILGTIDVIGVTETESYSVVLETVDGVVMVDLPAGDTDPFGYEKAIDQFLGMVDASRRGLAVVSPVPWAETRAILHGIATASSLAHP